MKGYKIIKQIGQTGMSTLYYAVKDIGNKDSLSYLIKKYDKNISDEMIDNERVISQTIEENCSCSVIVPILEGVQENEERYAIMQFRKNGLFLDEIIKKLEEHYGSGNIPLPTILEITGTILDSLATFHEYEHEGEKEGYLHLDLNPGNIFFESVNLEQKNWGSVKFIDFGSSVPFQDKDEILARRDWFCFSEVYSPREIMENMICYINKSSDVYSVCACMLRMITGSSFTGIDMDQIDMLLEKYNPIIASFLKDLIENTCYEPSYYRYEDAKGMKRDIKLLLKCFSWMEEGDYYQLLIHCYEHSLPIEVISNNKNIEEEGVWHALLSLKKDLVQNDVHYKKCLYIFECLLQMSKRNHIESMKIKSLLVECGLSCYNNAGQTMKAVNLYEENYSNLKVLSVQDYVTMQLRYAVSAADCYEFEKAYTIVCDVVQGMEKFKEVSHIPQTTGITELGRAYSAVGTYLAFLKKDNPMIWYEKALNEFKKDTGNCQITYSKILHYAIDKKDKGLYEKYAEIYFGRKGFEPKEKNIQKFIDMNYFSYEMLLYLKGINTFYWKEAESGFYSVLKQFLSQKQFFRKVHPEQLILKYSALLLYKHGEKEESQCIFMRALGWIKEGKIQKNKPLNIMMLMSYQMEWLSNELEGRDNNELLEQILRQCEQFSWIRLKEKVEKENTLIHILCHEYC